MAKRILIKIKNCFFLPYFLLSLLCCVIIPIFIGSCEKYFIFVFPIGIVACIGVILYLGYDKVKQIENSCKELERKADFLIWEEIGKYCLNSEYKTKEILEEETPRIKKRIEKRIESKK